MQIDSPNEDRMKVALIGTSGAGKTCFIAAMRWIGDCSADTRFTSVGASGDCKRYLDDLHEKVKEGEVPPGTPKEYELKFSERYVFCDGEPSVQIDFSLRDFKGGDLRLIDADNALFQSWAQSDLLVVLIDIENLKRQGIELQDNLRDLLSVLTRNEKNASQKRLAIVITQADKGGFSEAQHSPDAAERLLDENLHDFFKRIKTCGFKETKCFLLASIGLEPEKGADGKSRVPEVDGKREWRPFGYEELFDWICAFRRQEKISRFYEVLWEKAKPYVVALAVLAIGGVIWCGLIFHGYTKAKAMYYNPVSTLEEKAKATWKMRDKDRIYAIEKRVKAYEDEAETNREDKTLRDLLSSNTNFFDKAKLSEEQKKRVGRVNAEIADKLEEILFERIESAMKDYSGYESARKLIEEYRTDSTIAKNHQKEVDYYSDKLVLHKCTSAKQKIAYFDVGGPENTELMKKKLNQIRNFNYPSKEDKDRARKAVAAMEKLMRGSFTITEIRAEGLKNKRNTYVLIAGGVSETKDLKQYKKNGDGTPVETKRTDSKCPQWNDEEFLHTNLSWKPGQSIRVEWRRDSALSDKCIASIFSKNDWLGLLKLLQQKFGMSHDGYDNLNGPPSITIKCQEFPSPNEDLELIKRYVSPGTYWIEQ